MELGEVRFPQSKGVLWKEVMADYFISRLSFQCEGLIVRLIAFVFTHTYHYSECLSDCCIKPWFLWGGASPLSRQSTCSVCVFVGGLRHRAAQRLFHVCVACSRSIVTSLMPPSFGQFHRSQFCSLDFSTDLVFELGRFASVVVSFHIFSYIFHQLSPWVLIFWRILSPIHRQCALPVVGGCQNVMDRWETDPNPTR